MRCYFKGTTRSGAGNIITGATVSLFLVGAATPAKMYTSLTGTTAVYSTTSSTTDGSFELWVSRFDYDNDQKFAMVISKSGYTSVTYDNIIIDSVVLGTYSITTDITVTVNISIPKGVIYSIATGKTLTFSGLFQAGLYQVFSCVGTGSVAFSKKLNPRVEWWGGWEGTVPSVSATTNYNSLVAAMASCAGGIYIELPPGRFNILADIPFLKKNVTISGAGEAYGYNASNDPPTELVFGTGTYGFNTHPGVLGTAYYSTIKDIKIDGASVINEGVHLVGPHIVKNVTIRATNTYGINISDYGIGTIIDTVNLIENNAVGLGIHGANSTISTIRNLVTRENLGDGVHMEGGMGANFQDVISESNVGYGLHIYKPTGGVGFLSHLHFNNIWLEANTAGDLMVDSQVPGTDPPLYLTFRDSNIDDANINSVTRAEFFNCRITDALVVPTTSSGVWFYGGDIVAPTGNIYGSIGGYIPHPKPSFQARLTTDATDVTGDGTTFTVLFQTKTWDTGVNYTAATGKFVAPYTGIFRFNVQLALNQLAAAHNQHTVSLVTTNRTYPFLTDDFAAGASPFIGQRVISGSLLCDMDATEEAYVTVKISGSTKIVDILSAATNAVSFFAGELVGG